MTVFFKRRFSKVYKAKVSRLHNSYAKIVVKLLLLKLLLSYMETKIRATWYISSPKDLRHRQNRCTIDVIQPSSSVGGDS